MKRAVVLAVAGLGLVSPWILPTAAQAQSRSADDITRMLNSGPPAAYPAPAPAPTRTAPPPAQQPVQPNPAQPYPAQPYPSQPYPAPAGRSNAAQPQPQPAQPMPQPRPVQPMPQPQPQPQSGAAMPMAPRPVQPMPQPSGQRPATAPQPMPQPAPQPAAGRGPVIPVPTPSRPAGPPRVQPVPIAPAGVPTADLPPPAAPPSYHVLTNEEYMALPFTAEIPSGLEIGMGRPGPDFTIFSIRRNGVSLVMIFAGTSSQFPIYDGQLVQAGGRSSIVVNEEGRRVALEHLFESPTAPQEIHVWVASVEGADRILAERIAQSVDRK